MTMAQIRDQIDWVKMNHLVPAVIQDVASGELLMLGYMNEAALEKTIETGKVTFYSRSKQQLWQKGETSGHFLHLEDMRLDCDGDALLVRATPEGPTCHKGTGSCFGETGGGSFLVDLENLLQQRFDERPEGSYTTKLFEAGVDRMAQKVGEEGVEVALAAKNADPTQLTEEASDLVYHLLVLLKSQGLGLKEVVRELKSRHSK